MPRPSPFPMRLAVFVSGSGSNFQAILDAVACGSLRAEVVLCVSSRPDAGALARARHAGVRTLVIERQRSTDEEGEATELLAALDETGADFIALAGYLRRIPPGVVRVFRHRILNVHPALLPAFGGPGMYGRRVHEAVIEHGARWSGATVHLVDEEYDTGPIVLQEVVPVEPDDTPADLAARVLEVEHRLYPQALALFADGRVRVEGRRVRVNDPSEPFSSRLSR